MARKRAPTLKDRVLEHIRANPRTVVETAAESLGSDPALVQQAVEQLIRVGLVIMHPTDLWPEYEVAENASAQGKLFDAGVDFNG